ncbi:MAG: zinc-binding dehydrogenase [Geodermatophilaceae bacterium]|nr:zinc-binding dehydrogenase [Geodermatophilaceae bacterium]
MTRTVSTLVVDTPGQARLDHQPEPALAEGLFRAETLYTGLSAGTELTWFRGTNPNLSSTWDSELGLFDPTKASAGYPVRRMGYMEVARVTDSRTTAMPTGGLVAMAYGHKTVHHGDPLSEHIVALPEDLDPVLGVYVAHLGPICANGLLHSAPEATLASGLGDGVRGRLVLITGGGLIGLLTGLFARQHGAAEVVVADPTPQRRAAAERLGLTAVEESEDLARTLKQRWRHGAGDRGADVVFQCRGRGRSLALALRALRPQGIVVDLAFYTEGADAVRLGEEFHHNGLSLRCAQIGRVPRGQAHFWDRRRLSHETILLLQQHGSAIREYLVSDVVPLDSAPQLLAELSERRRHVLSAVFDTDAARRT